MVHGTCMVHTYYIHVPTYTFGLRFVSRCMNDYRVSSFHHEFRRKRKPDFAEEESVGLLKALRRGRRDESVVWRIELGMLQIQTGEQSVAESVALLKALSRGRRD